MRECTCSAWDDYIDAKLETELEDVMFQDYCVKDGARYVVPFYDCWLVEKYCYMGCGDEID